MELVNPNVNIWAILPETIVAVTGIIVMLYDCFAPRQRNVTGIISLVGLAASAVLLGMLWMDTAVPATS
jgi:NADH:ubiquinone oxidoreductase subunit 2 (subunit N)